MAESGISWARELIALAAAEPADEAALRALVAWLDRTVDADPLSTRQQLLTRAIAAAGRAWLAQREAETVHTTVRAAEDYLAAPSLALHDAYTLAATASYPFGAGDGCYAMDPPDCTPGSGCRSGAGTLLCIAHDIGAAEVLGAIARDVGAWVR